jgi:hypothetical protein
LNKGELLIHNTNEARIKYIILFCHFVTTPNKVQMQNVQRQFIQSLNDVINPVIFIKEPNKCKYIAIQVSYKVKYQYSDLFSVTAISTKILYLYPDFKFHIFKKHQSMMGFSCKVQNE